MKRKSFYVQPALAFLMIECAIYIIFLTEDLLGRFEVSLWLKYTGILLCAAFSLPGHDKLVALALVFTACADWFLLIRNEHWLFGITLFLCVQALYSIRLLRAGSPLALWMRAGLALVSITVPVLLNSITARNLLAVLYFSQLLSNAILAWSLPSMRLFAWGLILFAGGDLCVGLLHSSLLPLSLLTPASFGIWLFYLPSQVLIALSSLVPKEVPHENK